MHEGERLELYWIPLGAGQNLVRASGWVYEAVVAILGRRRRRPLFHSALVAHTAAGPVYVEMAPIPARSTPAGRGVVGEGPVGFRALGSLRIFRYEVRRWRLGVIPDLVHAVASPVVISSDRVDIGLLLDAVANVPTPTWGRDELGAGEMWNSNSVVSWALARVGLESLAGPPPEGGRAPGWDAGVRVAHRMPVAPAARRATRCAGR